MATVIEILADGLRSRGFDGLRQSDSDCGCLVDDLAPCGYSPTYCIPGYRGMSSEYPGEWAVFGDKAAADESIRAAAQKGDTL